MTDRYVDPSDTPYLVPFDGSFHVKDAPTKPPKNERDKDDEHEAALEKLVGRIEKLQRRLYADDRWSLLIVFQAMDAAGKDGTVRAVMSGVNPAGCQVYSFNRPSDEELDHDFLWRAQRCLPERGRIGIFNRSHYEEVLVVRVHPEFLDGQKLPGDRDLDRLWKERYESIRDFEKHLARNGTVIVKFWLHVSKGEQRKRFLDRIDDPDANWTFNPGDVKERARWDDYMSAYEDALNATSRPWAPWYAIPADDKDYMRRCVAEVLVDTLERMEPDFPDVSDETKAQMQELKRQLESE
ncbi:MAG: polyphosphate kinase 2 family protein [Sandaracinaceae bacterium]|nr:polyphosphate kinase 2 family protein [Sandaracinaceae bacterium]